MKSTNKSHKDKTYAFRITDRGAIDAVLMTMNALICITSTITAKKHDTVEELFATLKRQLSKYLGWLDRVPDGTLYESGISRKQLQLIKQNAQATLDRSVIPSEEDYKRHEKLMKEWETLEKAREEPLANRVKIMTDTSFLLSYLSGSDSNASSAKVIVNYLKTQRRHFDLCIPNLVVLELIAKLKQQHPFNKAKEQFERLLEEISESRIGINEERIDVFHIFDRYQRFSKKHLSSKLRGNDFIIATDGILIAAMILTCDRKMFEGIKKTYRDVFLITDSPKSYVGFITSFEKRKESCKLINPN